MKVLCIVDSYEWALANRARALQSFYSKHTFHIKHFNDLDKVNLNRYHIVYSLNWPIHGYIHNKIRNRRFRLITTISSHIGQPSDKTFRSILKQYDAISLSNAILYRQFKNKFPRMKLFYTPFGVDHRLFKPTTSPSQYNKIFAWVGNDTRDVKRVGLIKKIFKDIEEDVELKIINQNSHYSRKQMADFYNEVGTVICFSKSEGTPNPILEAAASGRSIISTNVGNVPELVKGSTIQIVKNGTHLKNAILRNSNNPAILDKEGLFLRERVNSYWNWDARCKDFNIFLGLK